MQQPIHRVFIGRDSRELRAFEVCRRSLIERASEPVLVEPLDIKALSAAGLYRRTWTLLEGQVHDALDGQVSTEFTYSRYLVPALCQWNGWAVFCDSDFLWRRDVAELLALADSRHAVQVVHHDQRPTEQTKMRGQRQDRYPRKNWTSLMLWNCAHPANRALTSFWVGSAPRQWLHRLAWLEDEQIGELPVEWNWLAGVPMPPVEPAAVHYTLGTPDMPGQAGAPYADEWRRFAA